MTYRIADRISDAADKALTAYHPVQRQLLFNRDITTTAAAADFLAPDYETGLHDPWLMPGMEAAVERILKAIENKEQICIFSDYDCDGIPGAVVLHDFLVAAGHDNFTNYIPHRHYEGFGLSDIAVEKIAKDGASLAITIDCGTTNTEAVAKANTLGLDVIITDHHEPGAELPAAVAVVNPKIGDTYPFDGLCGAGVVFKLVQALIEKGNFDIKPGWEKWWLDMVGIATIADMVPLVDENRVLATYGLQVLRKSRRPGLQQLLRKQRANQNYLTEDDIGFTIGPRINAASRMDTPEDAFHLLATTDEGDAGARVDHLEKLNTERKTMVASMTKELHTRIKSVNEIPDVLVFGSPDWRPALVGLSANKLAEEFNRPAFLWGKDGNGCFKGSCRSNGTVSVVTLMDAASEIFTEHGGHHQSGGFTVIDEAIHTLSESLNAAFVALGNGAIIEDEVVADCAISLDDITYDFIKAQQALGPYGMANPKPVYVLEGISPSDVALFGKTKEHTKLTFDTDGMAKEAIAFFKTPDQFTREPEVGTPITVLGNLEQSFFMGRLQTRLRIIDII